MHWAAVPLVSGRARQDRRRKGSRRGTGQGVVIGGWHPRRGPDRNRIVGHFGLNDDKFSLTVAGEASWRVCQIGWQLIAVVV